MKTAIIILLALFLAGCDTVPVKPPFPGPYTIGSKNEIPVCPPLKEQSGDAVPILDLLDTINDNYKLYHKCADYVNGWRTWYEKQKEIYNKK
jgi:hypothetical protein